MVCDVVTLDMKGCKVADTPFHIQGGDVIVDRMKVASGSDGQSLLTHIIAHLLRLSSLWDTYSVIHFTLYALSRVFSFSCINNYEITIN